MVDAVACLVRRTILRDEQQAVAQVETRARQSCEDATPEIERRERVGMGEERFGAAKEKDATIAQSEVKARQDPRLRFGVEVHQRVAADEQIDA